MELNQNNTPEWLAFWADKYRYRNPLLYENNIGQPLTADRTIELFKWKKGRQLYDNQLLSVQTNYVNALGSIPEIGSIEDGKAYVAKLGGGAIWGIFWLHCLDQVLFPIFDQHTYRAMRWIQTGAVSELPNYDPSKIRLYFEDYIPFLNRFDDADRRLVDKALFAFGKTKKRRRNGR